LSPADASLDVELIQSPLHCPLKAQVRLIYQMRKITGNERSYVEGEQRVSIEQHATAWRDAEIVRADETSPALFGIFDATGTGIQATTATINRPLGFDDYETAQAMANWMTTQHAASIGKKGLRLTLGGSPIRFPYPLLHAERIEAEEQREICASISLRPSQ
jgi:hypothetical protein